MTIKSKVMTKNRFFRWQIILILALYGCSVEISPSPGPTSITNSSINGAGVTTQANIGGSATPLGPTATGTGSISTPATPTTTGATLALNVTTGSTLPRSTLPVTWNELGLSGKLIYIAGFLQGNQISTDVRSLDLTNGNLSTLFQIPSEDWLESAVVSSDSKQFVLSVGLPVNSSGQTDLFTTPVDVSAPPRLLFNPATSQDQYYQPEWSPDGKYVYFTDYKYQSGDQEVMRMAYPNGKLEELADHSYWPRLSADGSHLVYVMSDPTTLINQLFVAKADGTDAHQVMLTGSNIPQIIDTPMFSPDGQTIIFSAPDPLQSSAPDWFEKLTGVTVAKADGNIPSDWWSVPATGGAPQQLTHTQSLSLFGCFSPDGKFIASLSTDGIFVMKPDGSDLTQLVSSDANIAGTVNWIP